MGRVMANPSCACRAKQTFGRPSCQSVHKSSIFVWCTSHQPGDGGTSEAIATSGDWSAVLSRACLLQLARSAVQAQKRLAVLRKAFRPVGPSRERNNAQRI